MLKLNDTLWVNMENVDEVEYFNNSKPYFSLKYKSGRIRNVECSDEIKKLRDWLETEEW